MSITEKTTQATYSYRTAGTLSALYHDGPHAGKLRTAKLVQVTREDTGSRYQVLVPMDGGAATCDCPSFQHRHKGLNDGGCKHCSYAIGYLLREAQAPAEDYEETARQERLSRARAEAALWD